MMTIQSIAYTNEAGTAVLIALGDGTKIGSPWPVTNWRREQVTEWLDEGGEIGAYEGPSLATVQAGAVAEIDRQAERERMLLLTPGDGQSLEYQAKREETERYEAQVDADETPDAADYPWMANEIGVTAETLEGVASVFAARNEAYQEQGRAITAVRLAAKNAVDAAESVEDVQAVLDGIEWP